MCNELREFEMQEWLEGPNSCTASSLRSRGVNQRGDASDSACQLPWQKGWPFGCDDTPGAGFSAVNEEASCLIVLGSTCRSDISMW